MMSGDALWVPDAYFAEGPHRAVRHQLSSRSRHELYPFAREFDIWTTPEGYLGYPFGWSPISIYYNPAEVSRPLTRGPVLLDPKYKGRIVIENQPEEIVAYMGKACRCRRRLQLTDDQLATVKGLPRAAQAEHPQVRRSRPPTASTR